MTQTMQKETMLEALTEAMNERGLVPTQTYPAAVNIPHIASTLWINGYPFFEHESKTPETRITAVQEMIKVGSLTWHSDGLITWTDGDWDEETLSNVQSLIDYHEGKARD